VKYVCIKHQTLLNLLIWLVSPSSCQIEAERKTEKVMSYCNAGRANSHRGNEFACSLVQLNHKSEHEKFHLGKHCYYANNLHEIAIGQFK
jgi:hypothetical protein